MRLMLTLLASGWLALGDGRAEGQQQRILPEPPAAGRFVVKDRDWPTQPGEASICLWKDDAIASLSITVDDNWAPDHAWWLEMGRKHGLRVTWFVISGRVGGRNASFGGTWDGFRKLLAAGHDVQSHTATHLHTEDPGWKGIESEYADSRKQIEAGLPGHRVLALAYPGGKNASLNDPALAARYYIGCRGTTGSVNPANKINYLRTHSVGGPIKFGNAQFESQDLLSTLEKGRARNAGLYRAWYCCHFHGVKPEERARTEESFAALGQKVAAGVLWAGLFKDVVRYGQERDTARLQVLQATPRQVVLTVTDEMDDALFDFPLTVKVRLAWLSARATQNGRAVACRVIEHDGATFALVDAVPDRGEVTVTP